ncbi:MAG: 2-succinyl-5-enolpyruvyl-6-hydroxy-3-cyclohexene-1-carboxylic-acid synthase [Chloroflexota bacterium]
MNKTDLAANINTQWAAIFLEELVASGLHHVCFAPGSRSTPLVLVAGLNPNVTMHRHLDERSAGFFALGLARATNRPVALICTSGTAVANFHPAVIEAFQSHVPLIILSADRPPELRGSGANQTIDQLKLFGDHARMFLEMPVPQEDAPPVVLRHLRTAAARIFAEASVPPAGPVHVNFPFRKPLEPSAQDTSDNNQSLSIADSKGLATPYTEFKRGKLVPTNDQIEWLTDLISAEPNGLIICGPNCPGGSFATGVSKLANLAGYPIVADPLSGVRFSSQDQDSLLLGGYDLLLQAAPEAWPPARAIIRFGDVPTSAALNTYINRSAPTHYLHIRHDGSWADDLHLVRQYWQVDESTLCQEATHALAAKGFSREKALWPEHLTQLEAQLWQTETGYQSESDLYDGSAVSAVLENLPDGAVLFAGNSLAIRHVDAYGRPTGKTSPYSVIVEPVGLTAMSQRPSVSQREPTDRLLPY